MHARSRFSFDSIQKAADRSEPDSVHATAVLSDPPPLRALRVNTVAVDEAAQKRICRAPLSAATAAAPSSYRA